MSIMILVWLPGGLFLFLFRSKSFDETRMNCSPVWHLLIHWWWDFLSPYGERLTLHAAISLNKNLECRKHVFILLSPLLLVAFTVFKEINLKTYYQPSLEGHSTESRLWQCMDGYLLTSIWAWFPMSFDAGLNRLRD